MRHRQPHLDLETRDATGRRVTYACDRRRARKRAQWLNLVRRLKARQAAASFR